MNIEQEIRVQIEKNKGLKLAVGEINNHLSILEGLLRSERADAQKQVDEAYQRGVEDGQNETWEAAKKIEFSISNGGITTDVMMEIFGTYMPNKVLRKFTAAEAIEKLKAYEEKKKQDDKIEVGDEVRHKEYKNRFVVTKMQDGHAYGISKDGSWNNFRNDGRIVKTGRHFDIEKILEEMRK